MEIYTCKVRFNNAIIFGDSYSTFEGFLPEGHSAYYSEKRTNDTDVIKVSDTWWHQVVTQANLNLILNDSWSGSTIGYTGYDNSDCSQTSSFIYRLDKLTKEGFFEKNEINTVFVFGGTNDSWANAPIGTIKYDDFQKQDLYSVLPAICYFFKTLKSVLPKADIYCMINTELKPEIADCFKKVCEKYGITKITFDQIDKTCGHPTVKGMKVIKDSVLNALKR